LKPHDIILGFRRTYIAAIHLIDIGREVVRFADIYVDPGFFDDCLNHVSEFGFDFLILRIGRTTEHEGSSEKQDKQSAKGLHVLAAQRGHQPPGHEPSNFRRRLFPVGLI